jgi:hypothetical protein
VFAPHSQYRAAVTPAQRGRGAALPPVSGADPTKPSTPRHVAMSWARRLKRVFSIEIESCARCGGKLKITLTTPPLAWTQHKAGYANRKGGQSWTGWVV